MMKKNNISAGDKIEISKINNHFSKKNTILGFWMFLMSDLIFFFTIFLVYFITKGNFFLYFKKNVDLTYVLIETFFLLASSVSCCLLNLNIKRNKINCVRFYGLITFFLGLCFLLMEIYEFGSFFKEGLYPQNSSFFSSFFTLVGFHGMHIFIGLIWMLVLLYQIFFSSINKLVKIRLICFSLFWHFLDIIWIFIYTFVYLFGVIS